MSFRGRGGGGGGSGGGRGGGRGGGGFGGRGGGRGGFGGARNFDQGPPESVVEIAEFMHPCEGEMVCKSLIDKVPHFNAPIYLENKQQIGKVDEILGPINSVFFSVKPTDGVKAASFSAKAKFYINPEKLLPLDRFLPKPPGPKRGAATPKGARGGSFGGRGGSFGGRGGGRGGSFGGGGGGGFSRGGGRGGGSGGFSGGRGGGGGGGFRGRGGGGFRGGR